MTGSLQSKLSLWLSLTILLAALGAGLFSFINAFAEANELQDDQLRQVATLLEQYQLPLAALRYQLPAPVADPEARIYVHDLHDPAPALPAGPEAERFPVDLPEGMQTLHFGEQKWRVFVKTLSATSRIAVAQQTELRDEIARDSALRTLLPSILLIPLLLGLVGVVINRMFRPLRQLATELDQRADSDLRPLALQEVPTEIRPFIGALNRLLLRVVRSMEVQRRFVADAAHELRSPLTALSLQAERLEACELSPMASERLVVLSRGLQRARALLEQLLALVRSQSPEVRTPKTAISLQRTFRRVLEDLMPLIEAKALDVGLLSASDVAVVVDEMDLLTLTKNLLENAIRYTPAAGRIDIQLELAAGHLIIDIEDSGPGIPVSERQRVFDPFYRVLGQEEVGSGLGLSIVKTIVERLGGTITLSDVHPGALAPGLHVQLALPLPDSEERPR